MSLISEKTLILCQIPVLIFTLQGVHMPILRKGFIGYSRDAFVMCYPVSLNYLTKYNFFH